MAVPPAPALVMLCRVCGHDAFYHRVWRDPRCRAGDCGICYAVELGKVKAES